METASKVCKLLEMLKKSFQCNICLELLSQPVSTNCNHQFCRSCFDELTESYSKKKKTAVCPLCKLKINKRGVSADNGISRLVDGVHNVCGAADKGIDIGFTLLLSERKKRRESKENSSKKNKKKRLEFIEKDEKEACSSKQVPQKQNKLQQDESIDERKQQIMEKDEKEACSSKLAPPKQKKLKQMKSIDKKCISKSTKVCLDEKPKCIDVSPPIKKKFIGTEKATSNNNKATYIKEKSKNSAPTTNTVDHNDFVSPSISSASSTTPILIDNMITAVRLEEQIEHKINDTSNDNVYNNSKNSIQHHKTKVHNRSRLKKYKKSTNNDNSNDAVVNKHVIPDQSFLPEHISPNNVCLEEAPTVNKPDLEEVPSSNKIELEEVIPSGKSFLDEVPTKVAEEDPEVLPLSDKCNYEEHSTFNRPCLDDAVSSNKPFSEETAPFNEPHLDEGISSTKPIEPSPAKTPDVQEAPQSKKPCLEESSQCHVDDISVNNKTHLTDDPPNKNFSIEEIQSLENSILEERAHCDYIQNKNNSTDHNRIQSEKFDDNTPPKNAISDNKAYHSKSNTGAAVTTKQSYDVEISDNKFLTSKHECILSWLNSIESPNKDLQKFANLSFMKVELPICPNSQNELRHFHKSEHVNTKENSRNIPTSSSSKQNFDNNNSKASESNTSQESLRHLNLKRKKRRRYSPKHNENNKNKELLNARPTSGNGNNTEQTLNKRLKIIAKHDGNKLAENLKEQSDNLTEKYSMLGSQELIPPTPPVHFNKTKNNSKTSYTSKLFANQTNANSLNYPNKKHEHSQIMKENFNKDIIESANKYEQNEDFKKCINDGIGDNKDTRNTKNSIIGLHDKTIDYSENQVSNKTEAEEEITENMDEQFTSHQSSTDFKGFSSSMKLSSSNKTKEVLSKTKELDISCLVGETKVKGDLDVENRQLNPDHVNFYNNESTDIVECTSKTKNLKKVDQNSLKENVETIDVASVNDNEEIIHKNNVSNNIQENTETFDINDHLTDDIEKFNETYNIIESANKSMNKKCEIPLDANLDDDEYAAGFSESIMGTLKNSKNSPDTKNIIDNEDANMFPSAINKQKDLTDVDQFFKSNDSYLNGNPDQLYDDCNTSYGQNNNKLNISKNMDSKEDQFFNDDDDVEEIMACENNETKLEKGLTSKKRKSEILNEIIDNKQNSKKTREERSKEFRNTFKKILKHQSNNDNVEIEDSPKEFNFSLEKERYKHSTNLSFSAATKRKCLSSKGTTKRQKINDEDDVEIENDESSDDSDDDESKKKKRSLHKSKQTECDLKREAKRKQREVLANKIKQFVTDLSRDLSQSHSEDENLSDDEKLLMKTVFNANKKFKKMSSKEDQATSSAINNKITPESEILPATKKHTTTELEKSYSNTPLRSSNTPNVNISPTTPMASKLKPVLQSTVINNKDNTKHSKLNIIAKIRKSYESKTDDDNNGVCKQSHKTNNIAMSASPKLKLAKIVDDTSSTTVSKNDKVNKDVLSLQVKAATPLTGSHETTVPSPQPLNANIQNENKQLDTIQSPHTTTNVKEGKEQEDLFPVFMTSRLSRKYVNLCESVLRKFGGRYSPAVDSDATHLIVTTDENGCISKNTYTYKYLMALVSQIWIVDFKWVFESAKAGKYIDEGKFEAKGDSMSGHENIPRLYRESGEKCQSLFDGYRLCLLGKFQESQIAKDQLATLLTKLSCDIAFSIDEVHCSSSQITTLLVTDNLNHLSSMERYKIKTQNLLCVHPEWIVESIINYKIQDLHKFRMQFTE